MRSFAVETGIVAPMDRANVDTDLIIPKQFLKVIGRSGFGAYLFDSIRYLDEGQPGQDCTGRPLNKEFPLNQSRYKDASILLARENFGCGSSREHAPWALEDFGFRCIIAPSFADIFYNNCFKNGLLPIILSSEIVDALFQNMYAEEGFKLVIDLQNEIVKSIDGTTEIPFVVDSFRRKCLLEGLDEIDLTLKSKDRISKYEDLRKQNSPWLFQSSAQ